jgi:tetratricopeptide (TPR) repeat protein
MSRCPLPAELANYLFGGAPELGDHVAACARCVSIAEALQRAPDIENLDAAVADVAVALHTAAVAVAELESSRTHTWPNVARDDVRLHSDAAVQQLLSAAHRAVRTSKARRAFELAQTAVTIAEGSRDARVRFLALKDFATFTFRIANDIDGAIRLLDRASDALPAIPCSRDYFAAVLNQTRAFIFGDALSARWDEALDELDRCEPVFARCDVKRWRASRHLRGAIFLRADRYGEAIDIYTALLDEEQDEHSRAALRSDLSHCYRRLGRPAEAVRFADAAIPVFAAEGDVPALARAMHLRGDALSLLGHHADAIPVLEAATRIFASAGLLDEELRTELVTLRAISAADPTTPELQPRLEAAYALACALDRDQPRRSAATRAAVWADLQACYARETLTQQVFEHAADYLHRLGRPRIGAYIPLQ